MGAVMESKGDLWQASWQSERAGPKPNEINEICKQIARGGGPMQLSSFSKHCLVYVCFESVSFTLKHLFQHLLDAQFDANDSNAYQDWVQFIIAVKVSLFLQNDKQTKMSSLHSMCLYSIYVGM